ncbi:hypothetical protein J0A67_20485 [Algoriphagus aestuariicola]|uniref:Uncharacterized protein n=1 Tax=Algoriphagus aestuariicola TaxID=1852016 RepID=A0ABS3BY61_9BACT|nr:hypothetical protein [Algoriphagus aestuariicola]MBN7803265.1 hypothetical protein [Algoriphagus aestuariicola]
MLIRQFLLVGLLFVFFSAEGQDYLDYHRSVRAIEASLLQEEWEEALALTLRLERDFEFLFKKDLKIALQLAYRVGDSVSFRRFSGKAFERGWDWKKAKKELRDNSDFELGLGDSLKSISKRTRRIPVPYPEIREQVKRLFIQDQWQALGGLFTFSAERQDRYAEKKFAPKAKKRVEEIRSIMDQVGYPGEMLIGNSVWASTILSHYNSISERFAKADTLYPALKDSLRRDLGLGKISPFEFTLIDNWYQSIVSGRQVESYGILEREVSDEALPMVDTNRLAVGLPTVADYNRLLDLQEKNGIRLFFGEAWGSNSPIEIKNKIPPSSRQAGF